MHDSVTQIKPGDKVVKNNTPTRIYEVSEYNMRDRNGNVVTQYVDLDWGGSVPRETLRLATDEEIKKYGDH